MACCKNVSLLTDDPCITGTLLTVGGNVFGIFQYIQIKVFLEFIPIKPM